MAEQAQQVNPLMIEPTLINIIHDHRFFAFPLQIVKEHIGLLLSCQFVHNLFRKFHDFDARTVGMLRATKRKHENKIRATIAPFLIIGLLHIIIAAWDAWGKAKQASEEAKATALFNLTKQANELLNRYKADVKVAELIRPFREDKIIRLPVPKEDRLFLLNFVAIEMAIHFCTIGINDIPPTDCKPHDNVPPEKREQVRQENIATARKRIDQGIAEWQLLIRYVSDRNKTTLQGIVPVPSTILDIEAAKAHVDRLKIVRKQLH